jgi:hypothetical protein
MSVRTLAGAAVLIATSACCVVPSFAAGASTPDVNVSRAASGPSAQAGTRVAASCEWVYREKLCQTEWGRRKYPGCC